MKSSAVTAMKNDRLEIRARPGLREKAKAIQERYAGYGDNLTDLIHILIDREYDRLTRPERPLLDQIDSHAAAIRLLIQGEHERQGWTEEAAEINELLTEIRSAK